MLVALGHGGQLLVVEPEGEGFAILADEHVGTLHQLGLGDGLQAADVGDGFLGQLLVLGGCLLEVLIGLLHAFHLLVAELEGLHERLNNRTGEALAAGGFGHHQHLQQQGMGIEVVGFEGEVEFDAPKPDGTMRKLIDVSKLHSLGWTHKVEIEDGVQKLFEWYKDSLS